jgi:hypothetical protein
LANALRMRPKLPKNKMEPAPEIRPMRGD